MSKYSFEHAQEEANKLKEKMESGEASNYENAEKKVEAEERIEYRKNSLVQALKYGIEHHEIEKIVDLTYEIPKEFLESEEAKESAKIAIYRVLNKYGDVEGAEILLKLFDIPEDLFYSDYVREIVHGLILHQLETGYGYNFDYLIERFKISDEFILSYDTQLSARHGVIRLLERLLRDENRYNRFSNNRDNLYSLIPSERKDVVQMLNYAKVEEIIKIIDTFKLSDSILKKEQNLVRDVIERLLDDGDTQSIESLKRVFKIE